MRKVIALLFALAILFLAPLNVEADEATPSSTATINSTTYVENIYLGLVHTVSCLTVGVSVNTQPCFGNPNPQPGVLGLIGNALATIFTTPPTQTSHYLAHFSQNLIPAKTANAQVAGTGSLVINTVFNLWETSRKFAYLVMIIIFIVVGLMIIFRQKINPQTVISIQAALPGLVIGLILITLSYFFAALLVDIAFLGIWVVSYFFFQAQSLDPSQTSNAITSINNIINNENSLTLFSYFVNAGNNVNFGATIEPIIHNITGTARDVMMIMISVIACQYGSQVVGFVAQVPVIGGVAIAASCAAAATTALASPANAVGTLLFVVFLFILLFQMVQLILRLLNNYLMILFLTFTAPFHFLAASLPGKQNIATDWVRNMLCNILVFPAVFGAFYFAAYILGRGFFTPYTIINGIAQNPRVPPLLGSLDNELIRFLIVFGVLVATPAIPNVICEAIGKLGRAGQLFGQEIQGGIKGGQGQLQQTIGGISATGGALGKAQWTVRKPQGTSPGPI